MTHTVQMQPKPEKLESEKQKVLDAKCFFHQESRAK